MSAALPFVAAGSTALSALSGFSAARSSKRQGEANARIEEMKTAEESRRLQREQMDIEAMSRATVAASGTTGEGSQALVLKDMKEEHARELKWLRTVGASNANLARQEGRNTSRQIIGQTISNIGSSSYSLYSMFGPKT